MAKAIKKPAQRQVLLHLEDVWKVYQMGEVEVAALKGVTVEIQKGDFVAIIGHIKASDEVHHG